MDWIREQARVRVELVDEADKTIAAHKLVALLARVDEGVSLRRAAQEYGYSYRHAWGLVQEAERRSGMQLMVRQVGGASGGGSVLTKAGRQTLQQLRFLNSRATLRGLDRTQPRILFLAATLEAVETGVVTAIAKACLNDLGIRLGHLAAGSGAALDVAKGGRIDLVLTHAPELEQEFVGQGWGVPGLALMRSQYVVVGPDNDPAGVCSLSASSDPLGAFVAIAASGAPFISRGDNSGTHIREQALWRAAGVQPERESYVKLGAGNQEVISRAAALGGYALVDESGIRRFGLAPGLRTVYRDTHSSEHMANRYSLTAVSADRKMNGEPNDNTTEFMNWIRERGAGIIRSAVAPADGQPMFEPIVQ